VVAGLIVEGAVRWVLLLFQSAATLRADNLFLRRQLALYIVSGRPARDPLLPVKPPGSLAWKQTFVRRSARPQ
jgi:hypothetical protein